MGLGDSMGFKSIGSSQCFSMESIEEAAVCICIDTTPTQRGFICDNSSRRLDTQARFKRMLSLVKLPALFIEVSIFLQLPVTVKENNGQFMEYVLFIPNIV